MTIQGGGRGNSQRTPAIFIMIKSASFINNFYPNQNLIINCCKNHGQITKSRCYSKHFKWNLLTIINNVSNSLRLRIRNYC